MALRLRWRALYSLLVLTALVLAHEKDSRLPEQTKDAQKDDILKGHLLGEDPATYAPPILHKVRLDPTLLPAESSPWEQVIEAVRKAQTVPRMPESVMQPALKTPDEVEKFSKAHWDQLTMIWEALLKDPAVSQMPNEIIYEVKALIPEVVAGLGEDATHEQIMQELKHICHALCHAWLHHPDNHKDVRKPTVEEILKNILIQGVPGFPEIIIPQIELPNKPFPIDDILREIQLEDRVIDAFEGHYGPPPPPFDPHGPPPPFGPPGPHGPLPPSELERRRDPRNGDHRGHHHKDHPENHRQHHEYPEAEQVPVTEIPVTVTVRFTPDGLVVEDTPEQLQAAEVREPASPKEQPLPDDEYRPSPRMVGMIVMFSFIWLLMGFSAYFMARCVMRKCKRRPARESQYQEILNHALPEQLRVGTNLPVIRERDPYAPPEPESAL